MVWPPTLPNMVCLRSIQSQRSSVMKNCDPFVSRAPLFAIATCPRWLNLIRLCSSSLKGSPYTDSPPRPVPVGSPVWIMKSLMTRCQMTPS